MIVKKILRIKYSKTGLLRFIGHLDTTRLLTRAISRSSIPILYSEGFSPHMRLSFGPSLPLGITSGCEYLDAVFNEAEASKSPLDWQNELQSSVPEGIGIEGLKIIEENSPTLAKLIDRAKYEILIPEKNAPSNEDLVRFLQEEAISVTKASEKGGKTVDIKPAIESFERLGDPVSESQLVHFQLVTKLSQPAQATPALVLKAFLGLRWETAAGLKIHRKELYSTTGTL